MILNLNIKDRVVTAELQASVKTAREKKSFDSASDAVSVAHLNREQFLIKPDLEANGCLGFWQFTKNGKKQ